jgi:hypothetical protein
MAADQPVSDEPQEEAPLYLMERTCKRVSTSTVDMKEQRLLNLHTAIKRLNMEGCC